MSWLVVSLLTFNVWGLPDLGFRVLSPLRPERMQGICEELKRSYASPDGWDVVLLQEVWLDEDRRTLEGCGYPHFAEREEPLLPLDSGLLILSRYPLEKISRLVYAAQPDPQSALEDGEALARKSALMAHVLHPSGPFWVANTHLVSDYSSDTHQPDHYLELRRRQLTSFVTWATRLAGHDPLILGGDLNFGPGSPLWSELEKLLEGFHPSPGSAGACTLCPPNSLHARNEGKVDHLFGSPQWQALTGGAAMATPLRFPDFEMSLSDHLGWETRFRAGH